MAQRRTVAVENTARAYLELLRATEVLAESHSEFIYDEAAVLLAQDV